MALADRVTDKPADKGPKESATSTMTADDPVLQEAFDSFASEGEDLNTPATDAPAEPDEAPESTDTTVEEPASGEEVPEVVAEPAATPATDAQPKPTKTEPTVDPLDGTAPLDYAVDGQPRAFDGILVDKTNGGAFILPDKLESVRARLVESDRTAAEMAPLRARLGEYDGLVHRSGPKGQEREYRGLEAFQQLTADAEANAAAGLFLLKTLKEAFPGVENAKAIDGVLDRAQLEHRLAAVQARERFAENIRSQRTTRETSAATTSGEGRWFADALQKMRTAFPQLTEEDHAAGRDWFAKRPQLLYRNASPADAQKFGVKVGERIADPQDMNEWFTERAATRTRENTKTSAQLTATGTATQHNAGMQKGRQPVRQNGSARRTTATPATTIPEPRSRAKAWSDPLDTALQELGITD